MEQDNEDIEWSYQISKEILIKSAAFLEYFISQKFALGNPPHPPGNFGITDANNYDWHRICRILELPNSTITPSMISQAHIQRTNGRYRREDAVKLMEDIQELQLGLIEQTSGMGRPTKLLRERKTTELSEEEMDLLLKKIKLNISLNTQLSCSTPITSVAKSLDSLSILEYLLF